MKYTKTVSGIVFVFAFGCGSADESDVEVIEGPAPIAATSSEAGEAENIAEDAQISEDATTSHELARIEFDDGNVLRFEQVGDGMLMLETGPSWNPRHYVPREGVSPLEAFKALAPDLDLPSALVEHDRLMFPHGAKLLPETIRPSDSPALQRLDDGSLVNEDVEHTGQFEQSGGLYPWSQFSQEWCNFAMNSPGDFKHGNSTGGHSHIVQKANHAYIAAGADIGDFGIQFCADDSCNAVYQVSPGTSASLNYSAGQSCSGSCAWWDFVCKALGPVQVCSPRYRRVVTTMSGISNGERQHDCGAFTEQ
jgi:hypothetical protein